MRAVLHQCTPLCASVNACLFHTQKPHYMSPKCSPRITVTGCARTWHGRALKAGIMLADVVQVYERALITYFPAVQQLRSPK